MKAKGLSVFAGALLSLSAMSHAQIPVVGQLPVVGDLLGGGLPGLGALPISLDVLPISSAPLGQLEALTSLGTSLVANPETLINIGMGTGVPLVMELVPLVNVLSTDPASLPNYLLGGGTVLTPALGGLLPVPFVVLPL